MSLREIGAHLGKAIPTVHSILTGSTKSREDYEKRAQYEDIATQVGDLMTCWERASPEAQRQFLHAINARLI